MTKPMTISLSTIVLGFTLAGALLHSAVLSFFMDTSKGVTVLRASIIVVLCLYTFAARARYKVTQIAMFAMGAFLIYLAVSSLFTAKLFGVVTYYALPLDVFFAIQTGILSLLVALEQPVVMSTAPQLSEPDNSHDVGPAFKTKTA